MMDHVQILREIMQVYDSSLLSESPPVDAQGDRGSTLEFDRVLDVMVDPAVAMCAAAAEEKARSRYRWDNAVFVLNCLCYIKVRYTRWGISDVLLIRWCIERVGTVFVY